MYNKILIIFMIFSSYFSLSQSYRIEGDSLIIFEEAFGANGFGCCSLIPDGKVIAYYNSDLPISDKTKYMEGHFLDNNFLGQWKFYHENGRLESEGEFILESEATLDLVPCEDIETGNVEFIEILRKKSVRNGVWCFYNENGELEKVLTYRLGVIVK